MFIAGCCCVSMLECAVQTANIGGPNIGACLTKTVARSMLKSIIVPPPSNVGKIGHCPIFQNIFCINGDKCERFVDEKERQKGLEYLGTITTQNMTDSDWPRLNGINPIDICPHARFARANLPFIP